MITSCPYRQSMLFHGKHILESVQKKLCPADTISVREVESMLTKNSAIHILDAANSILLYEEDMQGMHMLLEELPEQDVIIGYRRYINEIIRQCLTRKTCSKTHPPVHKKIRN
ncbi:MAG TPA: hypothetical protein PK859_08045 [Spirochaetota bacterium]|nr:hypothetical protein [Spirochaetota bacterium]HPR48594.1 hypothetical protein [Spirochaetota bacterium]